MSTPLRPNARQCRPYSQAAQKGRHKTLSKEKSHEFPHALSLKQPVERYASERRFEMHLFASVSQKLPASRQALRVICAL